MSYLADTEGTFHKESILSDDIDETINFCATQLNLIVNEIFDCGFNDDNEDNPCVSWNITTNKGTHILSVFPDNSFNFYKSDCE
ncbi:hypothetical protein [Iodobacter sp.]|uniref:hypothetical protein n=1 Tax=Iodobacter sp. TaxID=1915058 RepID=UPI0025D75532|nr:hypothetical protein [Iodobacter sp.]